MGHWHGEISSNVTFAYCTKGCIVVAVLRGRPLTHVDAKPKFIYRTFPFILLHENSQRGCIKGKKVRLFKSRQTQSTMEASIARKRTRLGRIRRVLYVTMASLRNSAPLHVRYAGIRKGFPGRIGAGAFPPLFPPSRLFPLSSFHGEDFPPAFEHELFFMRRNGLSILKARSYIFYLKWVLGSHVTASSRFQERMI